MRMTYETRNLPESFIPRPSHGSGLEERLHRDRQLVVKTVAHRGQIDEQIAEVKHHQVVMDSVEHHLSNSRTLLQHEHWTEPLPLSQPSVFRRSCSRIRGHTA